MKILTYFTSYVIVIDVYLILEHFRESEMSRMQGATSAAYPLRYVNEEQRSSRRISGSPFGRGAFGLQLQDIFIT